MKYYRLCPDRDISNPMVIERLDREVYIHGADRKQYDEAPGMQVAYFQNSAELEKPDLLEEPVMLVSDSLKCLLELYDPQMPMKGVQCYPENDEDMENYLYWWPYIEKADCLSEETKKYQTGLLEHLVIDRRRTGNRHILRVGGTLEEVVLVSLELVESMLRRGLWGMEFIPVDTAGGKR